MAVVEIVPANEVIAVEYEKSTPTDGLNTSVGAGPTLTVAFDSTLSKNAT